MPSVFITGHRGLLGATLRRVLEGAGFEVRIFEGDITDATALADALPFLDPIDVVVHTAAATDVNRCEQDKEWGTRVNVEGTKNIRDVAAKLGARLIYISTVSVFSGETGNYREDDQPDPKNHYNATKYLGEQCVAEYALSLILRINLVGVHPDGSRGKNFMEWLIDSVHENKDMKLFTDVRINPLSNWTLAEMISDIISRWPEARVLHLGSRTLLSKAEIGRLVLASYPDYHGKAEYVSSDILSAAAFRPREMWMNIERARVLGIELPMLENEVALILNSIKSR